jgi:hypothetical protein
MNAYIKSFHSILEDECYSRNEFASFTVHTGSSVNTWIITTIVAGMEALGTWHLLNIMKLLSISVALFSPFDTFCQQVFDLAIDGTEVFFGPGG